MFQPSTDARPVSGPAPTLVPIHRGHRPLSEHQDRRLDVNPALVDLVDPDDAEPDVSAMVWALAVASRTRGLSRRPRDESSLSWGPHLPTGAPALIAASMTLPMSVRSSAVMDGVQASSR